MSNRVQDMALVLETVASALTARVHLESTPSGKQLEISGAMLKALLAAIRSRSCLPCMSNCLRLSSEHGRSFSGLCPSAKRVAFCASYFSCADFDFFFGSLVSPRSKPPALSCTAISATSSTHSLQVLLPRLAKIYRLLYGRHARTGGIPYTSRRLSS